MNIATIAAILKLSPATADPAAIGGGFPLQALGEAPTIGLESASPNANFAETSFATLLDRYREPPCPAVQEADVGMDVAADHTIGGAFPASGNLCLPQSTPAAPAIGGTFPGSDNRIEESAPESELDQGDGPRPVPEEDRIVSESRMSLLSVVSTPIAAPPAVPKAGGDDSAGGFTHTVEATAPAPVPLRVSPGSWDVETDVSVQGDNFGWTLNPASEPLASVSPVSASNPNRDAQATRPPDVSSEAPVPLIPETDRPLSDSDVASPMPQQNVVAPQTGQREDVPDSAIETGDPASVSPSVAAQEISPAIFENSSSSPVERTLAQVVRERVVSLEQRVGRIELPAGFRAAAEQISEAVPWAVPLAFARARLADSTLLSSRGRDGIVQSQRSDAESPVSSASAMGSPFLQLDELFESLTATRSEPREEPLEQPATAQPALDREMSDLPTESFFRPEPSGTLHRADAGVVVEDLGTRLEPLVHQFLERGDSVESSRVVLRLDPPELGSVDVHVSLVADQISIRLIPTEESARQVLEQQLATLQQSLVEQGVFVESCIVQSDGGGAGSHHSRSAFATEDWQSGPAGRTGGRPVPAVPARPSRMLLDFVA